MSTRAQNKTLPFVLDIFHFWSARKLFHYLAKRLYNSYTFPRNYAIKTPKRKKPDPFFPFISSHHASAPAPPPRSPPFRSNSNPFYSFRDLLRRALHRCLFYYSRGCLMWYVLAATLFWRATLPDTRFSLL